MPKTRGMIFSLHTWSWCRLAPWWAPLATTWPKAETWGHPWPHLLLIVPADSVPVHLYISCWILAIAAPCSWVHAGSLWSIIRTIARAIEMARLCWPDPSSHTHLLKALTGVAPSGLLNSCATSKDFLFQTAPYPKFFWSLGVQLGPQW